MTKPIFVWIVCACLTGSISFAGGQILIEDVHPGDLKYTAFTLSQDSEIRIEGTAGSYSGSFSSLHSNGSDWKWEGSVTYYAWLLNGDTREVVWHALETRRKHREIYHKGSYQIEADLDLPAGNYELYFTGSPDRLRKNSLGGKVGDFLTARPFKDKYADDMMVRLTAVNADLKKVPKNSFVDDYRKNALLSLVRQGDEEEAQKSFGLSSTASFRIYAVGEGDERGVYDYAWIEDVDNHKRAWEMKVKNTDFGGGASKNIVSDEEISLPAGNYRIHYVSDDSHSFERWNAMPPQDPQFWGVTITPVSPADAHRVIPFEEKAHHQPVVAILGVGDDAFIKQGFSIEKAATYRVLALGEGRKDGEMYDFGQILDADTHERVWTMLDRRNEHAGGASKNRMLDEQVRLKPGNYILAYQTDDSHSYRDWNSTRPSNPEAYGISLWATNEDDAETVALFDAGNYQSESVIAQIINMDDDEVIKRRFSLSTATGVYIHAMGEGSGDRMYDFGWIENQEGEVVWRMHADETDHAGGARKNRIYEGSINLPAGDYVLMYETDDSHSPHRWNATAPNEVDRYGITLYFQD